MCDPGGRFNNYVIHAAAAQGMTMVMWDVNAADYKDADGNLPDPAASKARIKKVKPGALC